MKKFTLFHFFVPFILMLLFIGSPNKMQAQTFHSATDSVVPPYAAPQTAGWSGGFAFTPTQDLYISKLGKLVPDSGSYRWTIWDAATEKRIYQQDNALNTPGLYSYEAIDEQTALVLKAGTEYTLQLSTEDTVYINLGPIATNYGQHLNVTQGRNCFSGCNNNVHAFQPSGNPPSFYIGVPDFLYSLAPVKRGLNDAAVILVDSLTTFCPGQKDIYASIGNYGLNQIDSVEIHWEINGIPQAIVEYKQLLDTLNGSNPSTAKVLLGSHLFAAADPDTIKVWTVLPNGKVDTVIYGDTLSVIRQAGMAGNYTLNAALPAGNGNYQSFSDLAFELHAFGVCSAVNVAVSPGTYDEAFYLRDIPGASAVNTITIDGQDSTMAILTHDGSASYATVTFDGAKYVHLKNITVKCTGTSKAVNVLFANSADHNTVSNCFLKGSMTGTNTNFINVLFSAETSSNRSGAEANYNTISNNRIEGGTYGIKIEGASTNLNVGNKMLNNIIDSVYSYGMYLYYQDSLRVTGNYVNAVSRGNPAGNGIFNSNSSNVLLNKNYIHANRYGVNFTSNRYSEISNNMIISEAPTINIYGLNVFGDSIGIYHNSISVKNIAPAINFSGVGSDYDVRYNIFSAEHGPAFAFGFPLANFDELDYNIYYTEDGPALIEEAGISYSDLSSFQQSNTNYNVNSIEVDPQFSSSVDLHIIGATANDKGIGLVAIQEDIDGDPRPMPGSSLTDIGADEFDPPSCAPLYGLNAMHPVLDSITLQWSGGRLGNSFQYELVLADSAQGTGDSVITTLRSIRIGDLLPGTSYEFYVRQICARDDTSIWWGPVEFHTAEFIPYKEDFEDSRNGEFAHGWRSTTFELPRWDADTISPLGAIEDHTQTQGSGGIFAYLNTNFFPGSSQLISPLIYTDTNKYMEFSFWYHMYGANMGDLNVYVDTNGVSNLITTISGQKQLSRTDPWLEYSTYLYGYEGKYIQIRFEGAKGNGSNSSIGIDDISLDTVPPINAGVIGLKNILSTICAGTFTPIVDVKNIGIVDIDSVEIFWDLNGVLDSIMYSATILAGDTATVSLKNMTLNSSTFYDLQIYTKNPNSIADPVNVDDTLKLILRTGLSGNYIIDASLPVAIDNFQSISAAANALHTYGICGAVNFDIASGIYNEAVVLKEIDGASSVNTISFDGQDSSATIITHNGSMAYATWTFDGADYVTLKNMQIEYTDSTEGAALLFAKDATFNVVTNSILKVDTSSIQTELFNIIYSGSSLTNITGATADSNIISNNVINGGYHGIWIYGRNIRDIKGSQILNNKFRNTYYSGIYSYYQDSVDIKGNEIQMRNGRGRNSYGIFLRSTSNLQLEANYVHSEGYGAYIYGYNKASQTVEVINNMLISENTYGLYMRDVETAAVLYNSVQVNGTSPAVEFNSGSSVTLSDYDVRNNIFSASTSVALRTDQPNSMFVFFDHNAFYTTGANLLTINNSNYSDLLAYQTAFLSFNVHSIEGDPQFNSNTDLHIIGSFVNNKGDNTVGVGVDIDGDLRPISGLLVDIGADEFDPPTCPPVMNLSAGNALANSIVLEWEGGTGFFEYEIVLKGNPQGSGTGDTTLLDSLTVGGLNPNTAYEFYARKICGRADTSIWWGPVAFVTPKIEVNLGMSSMISPTGIAADSCYSTSHAIDVTVVNAGNIAIDFTLDTATVNVAVSGAAVQSFAFEINDNALNSGDPLQVGDSITVSMGTIDMTTLGTYNFKAYLDLAADNISTNDTISSGIENATTAGMVSASGDSICGAETVTLNSNASVGKIQWQRLAGGIFTDEANADSVNYEVQIDSTTSFRLLACGTEISDTLTIVFNEIPMAPITVNDTAIVFCGDSGTAVLSVSSTLAGAAFNWYADTSSTIVVANGDSLNFGLNTSIQTATTIYSDTFYVSVMEVLSGCESERSMVTGAVVCTVGEDKMPGKFGSVSIQPNPSKGVFNLVGNNVEEALEVSIYNTSGKLVYQMRSKVFQDFKQQIDLSGFSKGIYFVKLQGEASMEMRKLVIQ